MFNPAAERHLTDRGGHIQPGRWDDGKGDGCLTGRAPQQQQQPGRTELA
jgi:hypothetical protein